MNEEDKRYFVEVRPFRDERIFITDMITGYWTNDELDDLVIKLTEKDFEALSNKRVFKELTKDEAFLEMV